MEGDPGCGSRASPVSPQGMSPPRAHRSVCHHLLKEFMSFLLREGGCVGGWTRTCRTAPALRPAVHQAEGWTDHRRSLPASITP